jgi:hypothetical protein
MNMRNKNMNMRNKTMRLLFFALIFCFFAAVSPAQVYAAEGGWLEEQMRDNAEREAHNQAVQDELDRLERINKEAEQVEDDERAAERQRRQEEINEQNTLDEDYWAEQEMLYLEGIEKENEEAQRKQQEWLDNWNSMTYAEQMEALRKDYKIMQELERMSQEKVAAEVAADASKQITLKVNGRRITTDSPPMSL